MKTERGKIEKRRTRGKGKISKTSSFKRKILYLLANQKGANPCEKK